MASACFLRDSKTAIQPWIFTHRTDTKLKYNTSVQSTILWPHDVKSWLTGKDPDAGKDWRQKKRAAEDEMVRWYHQLIGHELGQTRGDSGEQGSLAHYNPWSHNELDTTWVTEQQQNCGMKDEVLVIARTRALSGVNENCPLFLIPNPCMCTCACVPSCLAHTHTRACTHTRTHTCVRTHTHRVQLSVLILPKGL